MSSVQTTEQDLERRSGDMLTVMDDAVDIPVLPHQPEHSGLASRPDSPLLDLTSRPEPPASNLEPRPERSVATEPASFPHAPRSPGGPSFPPERVGSLATRPPQIKTPTTCDVACTLVPSTDDLIHPDAQRRWAAKPLRERLELLRHARHWIATHTDLFTQSISPNLSRSQADTLIAEVLPLLDALRFLERNARKLLAPRRLGAKHRPLWLTGIHAELHRDPLGHILIIAPANFPLFLAGVQTAQALVAGNAVTWKPGAGGEKVARLFAHVLREAGLPRGILHVTEDTIEAAQTALSPRDPALQPDKVVFTGSATTGRKLLHSLADTLTPATLELSGADAVVVLPSADLSLAAKAIAFGLRLNGAEVCMSPRRLLATRETLNHLRPLLQTELSKLSPVPLRPQTAESLRTLLTEAQSQGAELLSTGQEPGWPIISNGNGGVPATEALGRRQTPPLLLNHATPQMAIARTDLFAPVLSLIEAPSVLHIPDLVNNNPYALTAAIFGNPREAATLATQLRVGTVLINDLIAPTADPRTPFGGRGQSGFGLTRGAEGLLEMTSPKTILRRNKGSSLHYDPLQDRDLPLFAGLIGALHAGSLHHRWHAFKNLITAARNRATSHSH